jgi:hypothetical protein
MKKIYLTIILLISLQAAAQKLFKGVGIFGSVTSNIHSYNNLDTDKKDSTYQYQHFYPQSHVSKEFINWGAGIFLELSRNNNVRWQTELEYINKGAKEMGLVNPYTGERTGVFSVNKTTYIQWNNYLKFYYPIFYSAHWYFMPGIRLEYLFKNSPTVYANVVGSFPKFWFSGDLGIGYEFPLTKKLSIFTEYHWNPDILPYKYNGNTNIRRRTHELRLGVVLRPRKRRIDDCNAPVYKGPAY